MSAEQGPISAAEKSGRLPTEVVTAVSAVVGDCGRCGSKCVHEHSHRYNSAHIWHIRILPAQQVPEQTAEVVEEGARQGVPAHSESHTVT